VAGDRDMQFALGEMSGKLDTLIQRFDEVKKDSADRFASFEVRVRALEHWKWLLVGAATAAGGGAGLLAQKLLGALNA
jgi:hypothetical protein